MLAMPMSSRLLSLSIGIDLRMSLRLAQDKCGERFPGLLLVDFILELICALKLLCLIDLIFFNLLYSFLEVVNILYIQALELQTLNNGSERVLVLFVNGSVLVFIGRTCWILLIPLVLVPD